MPLAHENWVDGQGVRFMPSYTIIINTLVNVLIMK
jgi:hypothetical protein